MSSARPVSRWPWLIALAVCVTAAAAILIAVPTRGWPADAPRTPDPLAPGLAALSDQQLVDLLPKRAEFPAPWAVKREHRSDAFGYFRTQPFHEALSDEPPECEQVGELAVGASPAAEVTAYDYDDPPEFEPRDIRLTIAREFDRGGFDAMIDLVSRCGRYTSGGVLFYTVRVLEDSRAENKSRGPQRFRIAKTTAADNGDPSVARIEYFSFARTSGLILVGYGRNDNEQLLGTLFESTLRRIGAG